jgi:hypothetical protein
MNRKGHEPVQSLRGKNVLSGLRENSACTNPFGQTMRCEINLSVIADPEMKEGRGDDLLLHQKVGPHLDLASDTEGLVR